MIDWDEAAREKKELNEKADRQRELDKQREADFNREYPAWSSALLAKFASEAEQFNATRAVMPSEKIEISHGQAKVELRKVSAPSGFFRVKVWRETHDLAKLECTVAGTEPDGRQGKPTVSTYSATWSSLGFVIRNSTGQPVHEDDFIQETMRPFSRYISG
ncbi:MAG TPA: hypothetical protein VLC46_03480 [Thermoanaerobaculia bacterium]|nr:hypothetical protein [Thermoanaerobaculia bacterium]